MQSTVHLFNTAIARLGGEQLALNASPQEQSNTGRICVNLFPHVLEMTLSAHAWAFATYRKTLSSPVLQGTLSNPVYPFVFELPKDCVKPIRLAGYAGANRTPEYVIEGRTIRCTQDSAVLVYVSRIDEPKLWPPLFADALAWAMAGELASAINNDPQKQQWCYEHHRAAIADAVVLDQTAQNPIKKPSEWEAARFGGGNY